MARLPVPGADDGTWSAILNDFLAQAHDTDGSIKAGAIEASAIADSTITEAKLSTAVQTKLNSVAGVTSVNSQTGAVTLAKADLGLGNVDNTSDATKNSAAVTLTNKTISGSSNTLSNIPQSAVTGLTADLAAKADSSVVSSLSADLADKADDSAVVHNTGAETIAGVKTFSSSPVVPTPGTNTAAANKAYVDSVAGGGGVVLWGGISGTLSDQSDVQNALDAKVGTTRTVNGHALSTDVTVTAGDIGLGNVTNTSDATKNSAAATLTNKTISGADNTLSNIPQAAVTGLTAGLAGKANASVTVSGGTSLTGGGDLSTNRTITLVNDAGTPGNGKYYGTDAGGTKGYFDLPSGGGDPAMGGDLTGTASNAQITAGAVGTNELATNAVTDGKVATGIAQSKITNLTSDLAGKANTSHTHAASDINSGTLNTARLGSGTANSSTYLRGDGTWATPTSGTVTYADVPAGSTFTVYKPTAGSWPGSRPSARTDIYFVFKGSGTAGTGTSPESIMIDGDDWQILP